MKKLFTALALALLISCMFSCVALADEHKWYVEEGSQVSFFSSLTAYHTVKCSDCDMFYTEVCSLEWVAKRVGDEYDMENHYARCGQCGGEYSAYGVASRRHSWDEGEVTLKPTSTTKGVRTQKCNDCKLTRMQEIPVLTYHAETAPTCTQDGNPKYWECSDCGKCFKDAEHNEQYENVVLQKLGHLYNGSSQVTAAAPFKHSVTCARENCDDYDSSKITVSCKQGEWYGKKGDDVYHYAKCVGTAAEEYKATQGCNQEYSAPHNWDEGRVTTLATCTTQGVLTYTCTTKTCGATKTEEFSVEMVHHEKVDAGCTQTGNVEYWQCSCCGKYFEDEGHRTEITDVGLPALGHLIIDEAEHLVFKMNGHFPEGYMHPIRCARENCDGQSPYVRYYYEYVFCTPGEWQKNAKEHYAKCTVCEQLCAKEEHAFGEGVVTLMPNCWNEGRVEYTCTGCGYVKSETLPALGHWFVDYEVKSSCTGAGYTARKCTRCGLIVGKDKVDPAGHKAGEWETLKAAACTDPGEEIVKCTVCGALLDTRTVGAIGHKWGEWSVVTPATTEKEGLEKRVCAHDASHVETRPIEQLAPTQEPSVEPGEPTLAPTAEPTQEPTTQPTQTPSADHKDEGKTDIPKTGDTRRTEMAWLMMAFAAAGLCALVVTRKREE